MKKVDCSKKLVLFTLQIVLALIGIGITAFFILNAVSGREMSLKNSFHCFIHLPSFMMVVILGSFGLIINRGFFIGINYFIAGIINTLFNIAMLYKNMSGPDQITPSLAAAILSTFYGSLLLIVMSITFGLIHKKHRQHSHAQALIIPKLN